MGQPACWSVEACHNAASTSIANTGTCNPPRPSTAAYASCSPGLQIGPHPVQSFHARRLSFKQQLSTLSSCSVASTACIVTYHETRRQKTRRPLFIQTLQFTSRSTLKDRGSSSTIFFRVLESCFLTAFDGRLTHSTRQASIEDCARGATVPFFGYSDLLTAFGQILAVLDTCFSTDEDGSQGVLPVATMHVVIFLAISLRAHTISEFSRFCI